MKLGSSAPIFDGSAFRQLQSDVGEQSAHEVLRIFIRDAKERISNMTGELEKDDRVAVMREAHALKSSSALFGFERASALAKALEDGAGCLPTSEISSAIRDLEAALERAGDFACASILKDHVGA